MTTPSSSVTSKGQVTLPKTMRDKLGIRPGQKVRFVLDGDSLVVLRSVRAADIAGSLRPSGGRLEGDSRRMYAAAATAATRRRQRIERDSSLGDADLSA